MERAAWLREKRRSLEEHYDTDFAPIYDEQWGVDISPTRERFFGDS